MSEKISWEEALKFYQEHKGPEDGTVESFRESYDKAKEVVVEGGRLYMRGVPFEVEFPDINLVYGWKPKPKKPWWRFWE